MQDNTTSIRFEIQVAASKIISQVMVRNENMQKELEAGITAAIENFDFKTYVEGLVSNQIKEALNSSASWGSIRELARTKADAIVDNYIKREMEAFQKDVESGGTFKHRK